MSKEEKACVSSIRKSGIYLLPNLFTTSALFFGFYAIVAAMKGRFEYAAIAIFIAMVMDGLDGRVARLTGTQSLFGAQYDSLSDMVCFGLAPALVVYQWGLFEMGNLGWLAAFIYTASTALRLARFNVQLTKMDKRYFLGIPCPLAASVIASMVWISTDFNIAGHKIRFLIVVITVLMGFLMVSPIRYHSFKEVNLRNKMPFVTTLLLLFILTVIAFDPPKVLFIISIIYAISGPVFWLKNKVKRRARSK